MNKIILIGNLTRDPELTTTSTGLSVCKFSLAVTRNSRSQETDFFNITVWRAQAESCAKWLKKGSKAAVFGSISIRNYDDQNGIKRYSVEVTAEEVQFLNSRTADDNKEDSVKGISELEPVDEDVPF